MPNKIINPRSGIAKDMFKGMADDLNKALAPVIGEMRAAGLSDDEINLTINRAMFDTFAGLHGFPPSHRP